MKIAAVIPARFGSTRFPGKPLAMISGKSMIERVYQQVRKSKRFSRIIVATDDSRIVREVERFGGEAVLTPSDLSTGSDRIWEAVGDSDFDAVVNIQGDEPLISEELISGIYDLLATGEHPVISAVYYNTSFSDFNSRHIVKVVLDNQWRSLYFSRSPIPFTPEDQFRGFYQHVGIYGFLIVALERFVNWSGSHLENYEKLEQLRFLANGLPIKMISSEWPSLGVDIPEDIQRIEAMIEKGQ